ncbi:hypothetical protein TRFO_32273 [Tritrichomonas foetus]|uniref:Ral GTPase-activating protein subunit alpha/beta N-terminal domain-containing protein n=1 Tax=Tritrichomonas foetus TaxID=1144522 RepID=A0A1J4JPH0_9EUKA|nr:hypothetical protein TRFO_32273 [Tritrichomonas foetus]|eukprot:OHT00923.1 hypothetical protein TRFO_32273 [Tritrichomonas foetus]
MCKTLIGICDSLYDFDFSKYIQPNEASKLRRHAFSTCFNITIRSNIKDKQNWELLTKYCFKWSVHCDFILTWDTYINFLFKHFLSKIYSLPNDCIDKITDFNHQNTDINFLFSKFLLLHDYKKSISSSNLLCITYSAISTMKSTALKICNQKSREKLFILKFPLDGFLRLVGKFLTFSPNINEIQYDQAFSINIRTIIEIISFFHCNEDKIDIINLISYISLFLNSPHQLSIGAFLFSANYLFESNKQILPFIAETVFKIIPIYNTKTLSCIHNDDGYAKFTSLFISSSEIIHGDLTKIFTNAWNIADSYESRFLLICYSINNKSCYHFVINQILQLFSNEKDIRAILMNSKDKKAISYVLGCIEYIGCASKISKTFAQYLNETELVCLILNCIQMVNPSKITLFMKIALAGLQMAINLIEWTDNIFHSKNNSASIFIFYEFLNSGILERKTRNRSSIITPKQGNEQKAYLRSHPNKDTKSKRKSCLRKQIYSLANMMISRINIHLPIHDYFSHKYMSSSLINEEFVIKTLNVKEDLSKISYYTVGNSLLVSFIEAFDDENGEKLIILTRGQFGKSIWTINDDYKGLLPNPKRSDEVNPTILQPPKQTNLPENLDKQDNKSHNKPTFNSNGIIAQLKTSDLLQVDKNLRNKYENSYIEWINWDDQDLLMIPFENKTNHHRPRICDFLTTLGIIENHNANHVRPQTYSNHIHDVIKKLDEVDNVILVPIEVIHILPSDQSLLNIEKSRNRMTNSLQSFLQQIGEPLEIEDGLIVPSIPIINAFIIIVLTDQLNILNQNGKWKNKLENPAVTLVFNDTNHKINILEQVSNGIYAKHLLLTIKPSINGLYTVSQNIKPKDLHISTFADQMTISPKAIAFNLMMTLEMLTKNRKTNEVNKYKQKRDILSQLCKEPCSESLGPTLTYKYI